MFLLFSNLLKFAFAAENEEKKFVEILSLSPPHVASNGRSENVKFFNHYLIKTRSKTDCTQLGYKSENSFGMLKFINPIKAKDFLIETDFSLSDVQKGGNKAGFGFWISDKTENNPDFYGGSQNYNGFGVVVDIKNEPIIRFMINNEFKGQQVPLKGYLSTMTLSIKKKQHTLSVNLFSSGKKFTIYEGKIRLQPEPYFSITSFSGSSKTVMLLQRVFFDKIIRLRSNVYVKGQKRGSSKFIFVVGFICILALAYYLRKKNEKTFELKN